MKLRLSALAVLCLSASPVFAGPATPEGAEALAALFRNYLGSADGVVNIAPDGDSYSATFDLAPFIAMIDEEGFDASVAPIQLSLTDLGDGRWDVRGDQPIAIAARVPGILDFNLTSENSSWHGVFDTAIKAFESSEGSATGITLHEAISEEPGGAETVIGYTIESVSYSSQAQAGLGGGVDGSSRTSVVGLNETITMPASADLPMPLDIQLTASSYDLTSEAKGLRTSEMLALWAWFVAHPSEDAIKADFEGLKSAVAAALPLWGNIRADATMNTLAVTTPFGGGSANSMGVEVEMNGVVSDGRFREKISFDGLQLPTEIMPPWVAPLLPENLSIDVAVEGFNLAAPAQILLDELEEPGKDPAPGLEERLLAALLPDGAVTVTLAPGGVGNTAIAIDYTGALVAGPMAMPSGSAVLGLSGVDELIAALGAAPADVSQGAIPAIMMARGMAREEAGRLIWEIVATELGEFSINGMDMSGMMGGQ